jgi:hypothetical protein
MKHWEIIESDVLLKCSDCNHQAKEWAECDELQEVDGTPLNELKEGSYKEDEICNQVRCPNCKSWYYF